MRPAKLCSNAGRGSRDDNLIPWPRSATTQSAPKRRLAVLGAEGYGEGRGEECGVEKGVRWARWPAEDEDLMALAMASPKPQSRKRSAKDSSHNRDHIQRALKFSQTRRQVLLPTQPTLSQA
jgi:hypothetical protein